MRLKELLPLGLLLFGGKKDAQASEPSAPTGDPDTQHPASLPAPDEPTTPPPATVTPTGGVALHSSQARTYALGKRAAQGLPWLDDIRAALARKGLPEVMALPLTRIIGIESGGKTSGRDTALGERGLTQITRDSLAAMGEPASAWDELIAPTTTRARQADLAVEHQAWLINSAVKKAGWTLAVTNDPLDVFWLGMLWRGLPLLVGELAKQRLLARTGPGPLRAQARAEMGHYVPSQRILWWALDAKRNAQGKVSGPGTLPGLYDRFVTYADVVVGDPRS